MANKTYLEVINEVLTRLREDTVVTPADSDYSSMIGVLVNEAKRAVEDSYSWPQLYQQLSITTASGTSEYSVTSSNERTVIISVLNTTNKSDLVPITPFRMGRLRNMNPDNGIPTHYAQSGVSASSLMDVSLYPTPNDAYSISIEAVVPQAELSNGSTVMLVPWEPVALRAYAYAIKERGEDQGTRFDETLDQYRRALGRYIVNNHHNREEAVWRVS